jgi:hypothetical protein
MSRRTVMRGIELTRNAALVQTDGFSIPSGFEWNNYGVGIRSALPVKAELFSVLSASR